ncbi:MAG: GAF domain-containing protein [Chloroflexaceae bacterium]|nr:GAF domain-containing protein [Chloroflexaceae bacterium]
MGAIALVSWLVFACKQLHAITAYPLEYLPFPLLMLSSLRFGVGGAVGASAIVSAIAVAGALQGVGPFLVKVSDPTEAVLLLQTFMAVSTITALILGAVVAERQQADEQLHRAMERDRLLSEVALRIHQSLDLEAILERTVADIRELLRADRVLYLALHEPQACMKVIAESVAPCYPSLLGWEPPPEFLAAAPSFDVHGQVLAIENTDCVESDPLLKQYYERNQIKAALVVPLVVQQQRLGVLIVHQCLAPRAWQIAEIDLLAQLATQIAIAIQQAQLYHQVQSLNCNLEQQVNERTQQLQEKMQELQQLYEMRNVFIQAVSHDLRTSIMGLLMILRNLQGRAGETLSLSRPILERIVQSGERQLSLINALSENHCGEVTECVLHRRPLDLQAFAGEILREFEPRLQQNGAVADNLVLQGLPAAAADREQLRRVFEHLLNNALKHNPPGVRIAIGATYENGCLRCTIADNGVGMNQLQCEQLFKLYVRGNCNQRLTGIGIGSYECRRIIEAHGGKIGVRSQPQRGSQFWFTLPLAEPALSAETHQA